MFKEPRSEGGSHIINKEGNVNEGSAFELALSKMTRDELLAAQKEYKDEMQKLSNLLTGAPGNWKGELSLTLARQNLAAVDKKLAEMPTEEIWDDQHTQGNAKGADWRTGEAPKNTK